MPSTAIGPQEPKSDAVAGKDFFHVLQTRAKSAKPGRTAVAGEKAPALREYRAIGRQHELGPGLIRYEDANGQHVVVSQAQTPELFEQVSADFKTLSGINASVADGYALVAEDDQAPARLGDYLNIGPPDETGPGLIRYQTQDGALHVLAERDNASAYRQVKADYQSLIGMNNSEADGYRIATDNESWPPYFKTTIGAVDEVGPGVIRFQHGDDKVVVARDDNPALFDYLAGVLEVWADPVKRDFIEDAMNSGASLPGQDDTAPDLDDYKGFGWLDGKQGEVLTYETHDGERKVVSRDMTPELFAKVSTANETWAQIHQSEAEGYSLAGPNDFLKNLDMTFGSPDELGQGLLRYQTAEGKFIVSADLSPQLYQDVLDKWDAWNQGAIVDVRGEHGLPPQSELDILAMGTGEHADETDKSSPELTVQELATRKMVDGYREGIDNGSIAKDDPRARLVRALEAQSAYYNGRGITGYEEAVTGFGTTWRTFDDKQTPLTSADMHDIIDGPELQKQLSELFNDETVQKDFTARLDEALGKVENRDEVRQKLIDTLSSSAYTEYLGELREQGHASEASADISRMLAALSVLDPHEAAKAAQLLQVNALTSDLDGLVEDPSKVDEAVKNKAAGDLFTLIKTVLGTTAGISRQTINSIDTFIKEFGGDEKIGSVTKAIESLQEKFKTGAPITADDIAKAVQQPYVPLADRGKIAGFLGTLNNTGLLGSFSGALSLVSGVYTLVRGADSLGEDPLARLGVARDFISFISMGPQFTKLFDSGFALLGKNGVSDALGVSKTLAENLGAAWIPTWDKPASISSIPIANVDFKLPEIPTGFADDLAREGNDIADRVLGNATPVDELARAATPELPSGNANTDGIRKLMDDLSGSASRPPVAGSKGMRIAGSVFKTLGAAADVVGGVADIVLAAFALKSGVASGDKASIAMGSLQVVSGTLSLTAGAIGAAGLFGSIGAAAALTGPLFIAALVLGGIAAIAGIFINHNKQQKATDKEGEWYKQLAADGLLQADWGDKVEFARYEIHNYGGRDAPDDDSIFRYHQEEWEYFDATPQEYGSSSNRLNEDLHDLRFDREYYDEHREVIETIRGHWDQWNGKDAIVSRKDLEKIAAGAGSDTEQAAAQFLLDNKELFDWLDIRGKDDGVDGKISTGDLDRWFAAIGV